MRRALCVIGLFFVFLVLDQRANASVLVVVADHLTLPDITDPKLTNIYRFCQEGRVAVMSPGLPHGADPVATVYATLGAGDTVQPEEVSAGLLARTLRAAHISYTVIGDADGDDTGSYRPIDSFLPISLDINPHALAGQFQGSRLNRPTWERIDPRAPGGISTDTDSLAGFASDSLSQFNVVVVHYGDFARLERENRAGFLLPAAYAAHRAQILNHFDSFIGLLLDLFRSNPSLSGPSGIEVFLVTPTPPMNQDGTWNRLTPFIQWHSGSETPGVLSSDTTHTSGLVAARDIAPTILASLNVPVPYTMTGAHIRAAPGDNRALRNAVSRLDRITWLNMAVQVPLFWGIGIIGAATVFIGIFLVLSGLIKAGSLGTRLWLYFLRTQAAWPLALLLAPAILPSTVALYVLEIVALTLLISLIPTPEWIFALTAVVVVVDGLFGSALVAQSVLSCYALSGIRFYGIGNEYMGLLLGGALLLCVVGRSVASPLREEGSGIGTSPNLSLERRGTGVGASASGLPVDGGGEVGVSETPPPARRLPGPPLSTGGRLEQRRPPSNPPLSTGGRLEQRRPPSHPPLSTGGRLGTFTIPALGRVRGGEIGILAWFGLVVFVLSFPAYGAKAGGAVTAMATFTMAWRGLAGRPARLIHLALAIAAGFVLVFVWALTGSTLGLRTTHEQTAVTALLHGRLGYIFGVVLRKAGLAVHVLLHPGTLWGIFALLLLGVLSRLWLWPRISGYLAERPRFAAVVVAGLWGCVVALLFNDSGSVAAILMFSTLILSLIHGIFSKSNHAPARS